MPTPSLSINTLQTINPVNEFDSPMNFIDLLATLHRLADDPRIHPSTPVEISYEFQVDDYAREQDQDSLVSVAIRDGKLILSTHSNEPAMAR